jgi:hypothetical protein
MNEAETRAEHLDPALKAVRFVQSLERKGQVIALMGNHDEKYVRYFHRQIRPQPTGPAFIPMSFPDEKKLIYDQLTAEELHWLADRPYCYRGDGA